MPVDENDLPSTLRRSSREAQRTFLATLASAEESYGSGGQARRTAFASLKHSFEKIGDHWEPKRQKGPSDPRAASGGSNPHGESFGGVDVLGHTRDELLERAKGLDVRGRSRMTKAELGRAIAREQQKLDRRAREQTD